MIIFIRIALSIASKPISPGKFDSFNNVTNVFISPNNVAE